MEIFSLTNCSLWRLNDSNFKQICFRFVYIISRCFSWQNDFDVHNFLSPIAYPDGIRTPRFKIIPLRRTTMRKLIRLIKCEEGATAIEYGLIAALIAVVIIAALTTLGTSLQSIFNSVASSL